MKPIKSNINPEGCLPTSSNCVIYQGECLECLGIKTGDTITETTEQLAKELCKIKEELDLTDLNLKCLFEACMSCPDPEMTLSNVLRLLIEKVCTLEDILEEGSVGSASTGGSTPTYVRVATCFQTPDVNGDPVLDVVLKDYVTMIGNRVCTILSTQSQHASTLTNHGSRITALENKPATGITSLPKVNPACVFGSDTTPKEIKPTLEALATQFCELRTATGASSALLNAASVQCPSLNTEGALGSAGTMSGLPGWKSTVTNLADSINNLWITICDMRKAVDALVVDNTSGSCEQTKVDFITAQVEEGARLQLFFAGYTIIPSGFSDCNVNGAKTTIRDSRGNSHVLYINLVGATANANPVSVDISLTPLAIGDIYTITLESCLTNGTQVCNKTIVKTTSGTTITCNAPTDVVATVS